MDLSHRGFKHLTEASKIGAFFYPDHCVTKKGYFNQNVIHTLHLSVESPSEYNYPLPSTQGN